MRYQRIDLNLLVALDVLLAEQNVTRASEKLHMTQPAMSGVLARLRDYFGDQLLVPVGRSLKLTPLAEQLVGPVRDIILRIDSTIATKPGFDPATAQRHFVVVASDYVSRVLLAEVLRRISHAAPGLTFDIKPTHATMAQELEQDKAEFLIIPAHLTLAEHPHSVLFEDTYKVIACAQNPALGEVLSFETYAALGHVVYDAPLGINPWFEQWYANQYRTPRRIEVVTHDFSLMPRFLIGTRRLATVQTRLALQFAQSMPIRVEEPPMQTPRLTEVLQWHRYRDDDPGSAWVRAQIVEVAQGLPPI